MDVRKLADEIINGKRLTREDDLSFFETADIDELSDGANEIRVKLNNNHVDLCTIINGRAGGCSENCKFCAQSAHSKTDCDRHGVVDPLEVLEDCKKREAAGVHAYSIVTAGRTVEGDARRGAAEGYAAPLLDLRWTARGRGGAQLAHDADDLFRVG